jgi:acyl-CoA synthetase (AMP-forming)/AMP-acid ligase II
MSAKMGGVPGLPKRSTAPLGRLGAAAQNALEVARFGGLDTDEEPSPYAVAAEHPIYRLRHYYPPAGDHHEDRPRDSVAPTPAVLLVPLGGDLGQIDPRKVRMPEWYRPNPGRAADLAFILFTGEGESVRTSRITNGRWVTSALGTACAAALSGADTVYSVTPVYHPSGLMVSSARRSPAALAWRWPRGSSRRRSGRRSAVTG